MSTRPSRALAVAALAAVLAAAAALPARAGSAILDRFTPDSGGFELYTAAPALPHRSGDYMFVIVANRLLCTVDAETGAYITSIDLGLDVFAGLERQPVAPMTLSEDGKVLALVAAGAVRFFDVGTGGRLSVRSEFAASTDAPAAVGMTEDGRMAIFASGPSPAAVATVRTSDAKLLDSVALSSDEAPIHSEYAATRSALTVVTAHGVLLFRHDERGKLKQTGQYRREGFVGDAYSGIEALGKRGRVVYTIEQNGSALIGLSLKGKQTTRAPAPGIDRFSSPVATTPDGKRIVALTVNGQTGAPSALVFFRGEGRSLKGDGNEFALDPSLGRVGQMLFDPEGALLAVSFPSAGAVLLVDVLTKQLVDEIDTVDAAEGIVFAPSGRALYVSGRRTAGAVTILPVSHRGFDDAGARFFERLPGVLFGPGDAAFAFANRFYGVASSGASGAVYSFNASSGSIIDQVDVGRSTGLLAVAPDAHTIVASGGGGLVVFKLDDSGRLTQRGEATPGAIPSRLAPSVAFHPSLAVAYVTAGADVWRVDLASGESEPFAIGSAGASLTNPVVSPVANRLYAVEDGARLVRMALDGEGRVSLVDRRALDVTLDPSAPRVAYDASGSHMWAASGSVVREYNLFVGSEVRVSESAAIGRSVVLVAPDLLAAIPDGEGSVVFFDLTSSTPTIAVEVPLPEAAAGGAPAVDAASRRVFVPLARSVVAVGADGVGTQIDDGSATLQLSFVTPLARLAYPDLAHFPGSVVVATGL